MVKYIDISSIKYKNLSIKIDDDDYDKVSKFKWNVVTSNSKKLYPSTKINNHHMLLHHFILNKPKKGYVIDHIDGDTLNCQKSNLREVTFSVNSQNKKRVSNSNNEIIYKGVCIFDNKFKCKALNKYIGLFDTEIEAAKAYDIYVLQILGKEASLNFTYTDEEIQNLLNIDITSFKKMKPKEEQHIRSIKNKFYFKVSKKIGNEIIKIEKSFNTFDEAKEYKIKTLEELENRYNKYCNDQMNEHYNKKIQYNKNNIAYINVKYKNNNYECLVDDDKWHDLMLYNWSFNGKNIFTTINNKSITISYYIYHKYFPDLNIKDKIIDHINGETPLLKKLDNRTINLRIVDYTINNYNKITKNKTGFRGVTFIKKNNIYRASLNYKEKTYYGGQFKTLIEAAKAYNKLAIQIYKDAAILNTFE